MYEIPPTCHCTENNEVCLRWYIVQKSSQASQKVPRIESTTCFDSLSHCLILLKLRFNDTAFLQFLPLEVTPVTQSTVPWLCRKTL